MRFVKMLNVKMLKLLHFLKCEVHLLFEFCSFRRLVYFGLFWRFLDTAMLFLRWLLCTYYPVVQDVALFLLVRFCVLGVEFFTVMILSSRFSFFSFALLVVEIFLVLSLCFGVGLECLLCGSVALGWYLFLLLQYSISSLNLGISYPRH
jgi:hypothetical protein